MTTTTSPFRDAMRDFALRMWELADKDAALKEALDAARVGLDAGGTQMTLTGRGALEAVAAAIAVDQQDYLREAFDSLTRESWDTIWDMLPKDIQDLLDNCWPQEGGKTFLGKIGITTVSEGFRFQ